MAGTASRGHRIVWPRPRVVAIEEFEVPSPGDGEVLVETECTLISPGTERAYLLGLPNAEQPFPAYPGYSNVGRVIEAGARTAGLRAGDRVASEAPHASHCVVPAVKAVKIPEPSLPSEHAAFFNLCAIALQGVRKSRLEIGEPALVMGLGVIGLLAVQAARLSGAFPVVGSDPVEIRRQVALRVGADAALDPRAPASAAELARAAGDRGPSVVIEASGQPDAVIEAFRLAAAQARVVLLASTRGETGKVNFYKDVHWKGLTVIGAHNFVRPQQESSPHFWTARDDVSLALQMTAAGRFRVDELISHRYRWDRAEEAYRALMGWEPGLLGAILEWGQG